MPADSATFAEQAALVVRQYDGYVQVDTFHVNGRLTLGENIADYGGVLTGYDALQRALERNGRPGKIEGYTPEQRFFIAYAQSCRQHNAAGVAPDPRDGGSAFAGAVAGERAVVEHGRSSPRRSGASLGIRWCGRRRWCRGSGEVDLVPTLWAPKTPRQDSQPLLEHRNGRKKPEKARNRQGTLIIPRRKPNSV